MKTLLKLYSFESVHGTPDEGALADWLENWFREHRTPFTRVGDNFYKLDKAQAPILSAHLDQVKTNGKAVHFVLTPDKHIQGYNADWERTSLGGDDKNGVWIILKMLEEFNNDINFIISAGEEVGCVGINKLDTDGVLKEKIPPLNTFCIVLDRRGGKDVLDSGGGDTYCKTLAQCICNFLGNDMSVTSGSISDTRVICEYCESVNMSVAYEAPHTANEHTDWVRLEQIKEYVKRLCDDFAHYPTPPDVYIKKSWSYTSTRKSKKFNYNEWKDDYDDYYGRFGY